jgi:pyruvate,water dikinase
LSEEQAMELVWLGDSAASDSGLVGGKVAALSRLATRYLVPPGFCLTTVAYDQWCPEGKLANPGLAPPLYTRVATAYAMLATGSLQAEPSVAVRSSAVEEDGQTTSFAGQFESYLNIVGTNAIVAAIARCWATAQQARVRAYRHQHGLGGEQIRLAVLVQQLILADVSAVVFSANPVTGVRTEVVINASWGLGESIVGGSVTPDTYTICKADVSIAARTIAPKQRMTIVAAEGTQMVAVPRLLQTRPALTDGQVRELARLALALEAELGRPVDLECAYQGGKLYLLQCRPITSGA